MIFKNNKIYDILKWAVMIVMPAISLFWTQMAETWGFPYGPQIGTTIDAVTVLLGTCLCISAVRYNKKQVK